jgi:hypothetical protein
MTPNDEYDTPWKDAVTRYFPEFMAFYFADAYAQIDWQRPCVFLEQELAQVTRDAQLGCKRVDKLVRVTKRDGADEFVFVHIDVQGSVDRGFAERVFVYNYRIYDRYRRPVASLALLADGNRRWKPSGFDYKLFGCAMGIQFPIAKLSDYAARLEELLEHPNVFALVTAAHILTQQTKHRDVERHEAKSLLARKLYQRDFDRQRIIDLFNIIDWIMQIPEPLQLQLMRDISELERERNMPYISSFQRLGRQEGLLEGRQEGRQEERQEVLRFLLEKRFGTLPPAVLDRLAKADPPELKAWVEAVLDAPTLDSVFSGR